MPDDRDGIWPPIEEFGDFKFVRREILDVFVNSAGAETCSATIVTRQAQQHDSRERESG